MSLFELARKIIKIIKAICNFIDDADNSNYGNYNQSTNNSVANKDDPYVKLLLNENEIRHLKETIDYLNKERNYTNEEIRELRKKVDILSERCEKATIKNYEYIIELQNKTSQHTPQDNMDESHSNHNHRKR